METIKESAENSNVHKHLKGTKPIVEREFRE